MNRVLNGFVFFDDTSTSQTSNPLANPNNASTIVITVNGLESAGGELSVEALNDLSEKDTYFPVSAIGFGDYKIYSSITKDGIYAIPFEGLYRCRMVSSIAPGSFKVYGLSIEG